MFNIQENENQEQNLEFTRENQEHLARLEQDYLKELNRQEFVKSWLEMVMFNSMNVFITLWLIHVGSTLFLAVLGGFTIGSVPAMKAIADNFNISKDSESMNFSVNGKLINGLIKLILAGTLTFVATSEIRNILKIADVSATAYEQDKQDYERDKRQGINPDLKFIILTGCGAAAGVMGYKFLKDLMD
ncbi:hypothetical protein NIES2100_05170 [Calothrix sp. NIES-2100]|uniref:hypothetical protein n=1 Tax=Calothrix sp. NIES-2100 TaxID=1954172 RepID=UPI000B6132FA|nr:hypothetical protein NIES2100_05170 [Calothrix sp. NIES-2100]